MDVLSQASGMLAWLSSVEVPRLTPLLGIGVALVVAVLRFVRDMKLLAISDCAVKAGRPVRVKCGRSELEVHPGARGPPHAPNPISVSRDTLHSSSLSNETRARARTTRTPLVRRWTRPRRPRVRT